ncbi:hypothetical protein PIB30_040140 [Stylosanthes scabra]|uniref:Uncharacterized protein n=1 Tax=Stylosanthes scabra TaxID=79078 RepID=A0ABU6UGH6_9FABA|nr:hypothetical protein [Stylosanthes scabra]
MRSSSRHCCHITSVVSCVQTSVPSPLVGPDAFSCQSPRHLLLRSRWRCLRSGNLALSAALPLLSSPSPTLYHTFATGHHRMTIPSLIPAPPLPSWLSKKTRSSSLMIDAALYLYLSVADVLIQIEGPPLARTLAKSYRLSLQDTAR